MKQQINGNEVTEERHENLVFTGQEPQSLSAALIPGGIVKLYGPHDSDPDSRPIQYQEVKDYIVDYVAGTVARTMTSRIPDWRDNPAYGLDNFDHRAGTSYSNVGFTCSIVYQCPISPDTLVERSLLKEKLPNLYKQLTESKKAVCVIYGDSISMGAEVSSPELSFFGRFVNCLRQDYPEATIQAEMRAIGGETSSGGLKRIEEILSTNPDLVLIGYGMNDQNRTADGGNSVSVLDYERNIREMIAAISSHSRADVILITPCLPNPHWMFASDNVRAYATALRHIAVDSEVALADVQAEWERLLLSGKSHQSLLVNNLNHPNDYGHYVYFSVLRKLLADASRFCANTG